MIGCVLLNDVVFFDQSVEGPATFAKSIVRGKTYWDPTIDSAVEAALESLLLVARTQSEPTP